MLFILWTFVVCWYLFDLTLILAIRLFLLREIGGYKVVILIFDEVLQWEGLLECLFALNRVWHFISDIVLDVLHHPAMVRLLQTLPVVLDPVLLVVLLVNQLLVLFVLADFLVWLWLVALLLELVEQLILHLG